MAIPRVRKARARLANFPKSHDLYLGTNINRLIKEMDFALLVESRTPWYPPSNVPANATIVALGETPLKTHMVYQTMEAAHYLEGKRGATLRLLIQALRRLDCDAAKVTERRARWQAGHKAWREGCVRSRTRVGRRCHHGAAACQVLREVMPPRHELCGRDDRACRCDPRAYDVGRAVGFSSARRADSDKPSACIGASSWRCRSVLWS